MNQTIIFKSVKTKTLAAVTAVIAAVAIPQLFHVIGAVSGTGTALGETWLPMHLAIFMVGFLAGAEVGVISGALAPLVSFALTGMPTSVMLPFMMIELAVYGLTSGLMAKTKVPVIGKLLTSQIAGRAVRAIAILIGFYALGTKVQPAVILSSIRAGLPGLLLQWVLIPLIMFRITRNGESND